MGPFYKDGWIVEKGLGADEAVVVDGVQKVQPGMVVRAAAYTPPAPPVAATSQAAAGTPAPPAAAPTPAAGTAGAAPAQR
jgi:hypothetical protein